MGKDNMEFYQDEHLQVPSAQKDDASSSSLTTSATTTTSTHAVYDLPGQARDGEFSLRNIFNQESSWGKHRLLEVPSLAGI